MAKKPIQTPESFADLTFPLQGIDLLAEFELQQPGTTPVGQNVRGYEPGTLRARGGSRPAITPYVPAQLPTGPSLIQHLNYVVDPTEAGLLAGNDPLDGGGQGGIQDPSTNNNAGGLGDRNPGGNRYVRNGGNGIGQNRHRYTGTKPTPTITPRNITKAAGQVFTFAGTEFDATGLLAGDQILSVTLTSAGSPATAQPGQYQIGASLAVGNASFTLHLGQFLYNPPVYRTGIMTVTAVTPVFYNIQRSGGHSGLSLQNLSIATLVSNPPVGLGQAQWRVIQYLKADTFPPTLIAESGTMTGAGLPNGLLSPIMVYQGAFVPPSFDWSQAIRLEYSPDGTNWPPPPTL